MKGSPFTSLCAQLAQTTTAKIDLHTHTTASDGDWTPALLIQQALQRKMKVLAITDHDTTHGFELASKIPIGEMQLIPGVEITCLFKNRETHLLAYFFDIGNSDLQRLLAKVRDGRRQRFIARCELFRAAGLKIEVDAFLDDPERSLGRRHLAKHLVQSNQAKSTTEAFQKYLGPVFGAILPAVGVPIQEAIATVKSAGGLTSLAHPAKDLSMEAIQELKSFGLNALECEYPWPRPSHGRKLRDWAKSLDLAITGGSDFHGNDKGPRALGGRGIGSPDWDDLKRRLPDESKYNDCEGE